MHIQKSITINDHGWLINAATRDTFGVRSHQAKHVWIWQACKNTVIKFCSLISQQVDTVFS